jgi:glycosyltransferase involved in cell wall biosynthesis
MDIICLSSDHWDAPLWTNKQHIMSRLAKAGHRVLYVDPPMGMATLWRERGVRPYSEKRWLHWTQQPMPNLWVHSVLGFPFSQLSAIDRFVNPRLRLVALKRVMKRLRFSPPVLWIYHPNNIFFVGDLGEKLVVYDCVDKIAALMGDSWQQQITKKNEQRLLEVADLVFTTSQSLYEACKKVNPNTYLAENVADYDHFSKAQEAGPIPADIATIRRPIVGFIGNILERKVDLQFLVEVARSHPEWSLVLIGPVYEAEMERKLSDMPNIHLLGYKEYETLPDYLRAFDVCVIPYRTDNEYICNVFPMKFFEFLSTGKPVVTTNTPSLAAYAQVARIATDANDFIRHVAEALDENDPALVEKRLESARQNTWEMRINRIMEIVQAELGAKSSRRVF